MARSTGFRRLTRSQRYERSEDVGRNPTRNSTIGDVIADRFGRRDVLRGALGVAAIGATIGPLALAAGAGRAKEPSPFRFEELPVGADDDHHVAPGYDADVLIRWGDPVLPRAPAFDPNAQTAAAQQQQFGYNNDFIGYFCMPGASRSRWRRMVDRSSRCGVMRRSGESYRIRATRVGSMRRPPWRSRVPPPDTSGCRPTSIRPDGACSA